MQDRPTAQELLHAARDFCERDLIPALGHLEAALTRKSDELESRAR